MRATADHGPAVGFNPDAFTDRDLVVRIDDAAGNPYAVLVNYQCHGTVLNHEIAPGAAEQLTREMTALLASLR